MNESSALTVLEALASSLTAALRTPDGVAEPVALLWADADRQWRAILPALKRVSDQVYELGDYAPDLNCGPVIWLKCIVDQTLPDHKRAPGATPVLYLPGISRQELRAATGCPRHLEPLIELQYRGAVWHQRNGRDWTVEAFLISEDGLGFEIAQDSATRTAMLRALPLLANAPVETLRGRRLEAEDFDQLAIGDAVRDILLWMSAPEAFQQRCDDARWASFKSVCLREFKFEVDVGGPEAAAESLMHGGGKWDDVWHRFCDSPQLYSGISDLLRRANPRDLLVEASRRPSVNDEREQSLYEELERLVTLSQASACERLRALEAEHSERRGWVWARLGESRYAIMLEPLARLAEEAKSPLSAPSVEDLATEYAAHGWRCDRDAIDALSLPKPGKDSELICKLVRLFYAPWLDQSARRLQELMSLPERDPGKLPSGIDGERDTCILFVDGLRFDIGARLVERLEMRALHARISHRFSPIPTVTATAKPVASPAHTVCYGGAQAGDFSPLVRPANLPENAERLRAVMVQQGVEVISRDEVRIATGGELGGWTETGEIDALGHDVAVHVFLSQLQSQIDAIAERITALLESGWVRVRVVTDHGWLLLPGGLPKVELAPFLIETKWARSAVVQGESHVSVPTYPWYWNPLIRIATPPGIGAFRAGTEYAHGGVSLQESVIPELIVERGDAEVKARITQITWRGMRCRIGVETNGSGLLVDIRRIWKSPASSIAASVKKLDASGEVSIAVGDDNYEGAAAAVVVLETSGRVLDHRTTTVGDQS